MKSLKLFVVSLLFVLLTFHHAFGVNQNPGNHADVKYVEGELLVKFNPGVPGAEKRNAHARAGASIIKEFPSLGIYHVAIAKGQSVEEAVSLYSRNPNIAYAEPNYIVSADMFPNDPDLSQLWGLHNTGQTGGIVDADIDAPEAWDITHGISNTVVAVIDTGIDYNHEDLAANMWVNEAEYFGTPGVDDNTNGYVDDIYGIDTINGDSDPMDDHSHGTHVAGTIGATGSNGIGVTGVNWNIRILACKFLGSDGYGDIADAVECLTYITSLKNSGENIIATNNSWSGNGFSQSLKDAIDAQREILLFAAAANNSTDNDLIPRYPASYYLPNVIAVTATNSSDGQVYNYGRRSVHLGAPGYLINSTVPGNAYGLKSGTSMATPHAAGVAGLIKAQDEGRDWRAIKNILLSGGDSIASMDTTTITGKRLNALGALNCLDSPVFSALKYPLNPLVGVPETLSALSINCQWPMGPVTVTISGSEFIDLYDDGIEPDQAAGDGIFSGTWVPQSSDSQILDFSSPAGGDSVVVNPITITGTSVAPPAVVVEPDASSCALSVAYSQTFSTSGGVAPLQWTISAGSLPSGLYINGTTGEISGTPSSPGSFSFTVKVTESSGSFGTMDYTIVVHKDIRSGYPVELQKRVGTGLLPRSSSPIFADLDNDGSQEVVVADEETLYIFGPGGLVDKVVLPALVSTPAAADLDGDADLEIIVTVGWPSLNPPVYAFHHDLSTVTGFPAGAYSTYNGSPGSLSVPVIEDLDGNGSSEIIFSASPNNTNDPNYGEAVLIVVDSSGATLAGWPLILDDNLPAGGPLHPAVEDVDGDGTKEIIYVSQNNMVYILAPDGTIENQWSVAADFDKIWDASIADVDADGSLDIILRYNTSSSTDIVVFDSTGNILPGWPQTFIADSSNKGLALADLDGNGTQEVIAPIYDQVHVIQYDGSSFPNWPVSPSWWPHIDCYPVAGDINGDGQTEILFNTVNWWNDAGAIYAYTSGGSLLSEYPKYTTPGSEIRTTPALGDFDNNRKVDIAVKSEDGMLYVWESPLQSNNISLAWPMFRNDERHTGSLPLAALDIQTDSLPNAKLGTPYSATLTALNGAPPYAWSITAGSLPDGLSLDGVTGEISGVPTTGGWFAFRVQVTDSALNTDSRDLSISVQDLLITTASFPPADIGVPYSQLLEASGGIYPYTWSITSGSLPDGLILDPVGSILGTPTVDGTFNFTVQVEDMELNTDVKDLSITVDAAYQRLWHKTFDSGGPDRARDIAVDSSGNMYVVGESSNGTYDTLLTMKLDTDGNQIWARSYDSGFASTARTVMLDASGNAYVLGYHQDGGWVHDVIIYDPDGNVVDTFNISSSMQPFDLAVDRADGSFYITGSGFQLYKYDVDGNPLWNRVHSGNTAESVFVDADGNVYIAGYEWVSTQGNALAVKYDASGNELTVLNYDSGLHDYAYDVAVDPDGNVVVAGYTDNGTNHDRLILKYDQSDNLIMERSYDDGANEYIREIVVGSDGSVYEVPNGQTMVKYDIYGNEVWRVTEPQIYLNGIDIDDEETIYVTGYNFSGDANYHVFKYKQNLPLRILTTVLPDANVTIPYSQTLEVWGGTLPYTWSIDAGTLPDGLSLDIASGVLSGTPTTAGTFDFVASVTDSRGKTAFMGFSITVYELRITTSSLSYGIVGTSYVQGLSVEGGTVPYTWAVTAGALPDGLSLDSASGVISGTPTTAGASNFTVQVTDATLTSVTKDLGIAVYDPLAVTTSSLPYGVTGTAYSQGLSASGGLMPYTWVITAGTLPDGLTLDGASGVISGTPTTAGSSNFTIQVTDGNLNSATTDLSIAVYDPITITTSALPSGLTGQAYSEGLTASGGLTPYSWSVTAGALPDGLSLDGATGVISGIPSVYGMFEFTVEATDANSGAATQDLSIAIGATTTYYIHTASGCGQTTYTSGPQYAHLGTASGDCATEDIIRWKFRGGPRDMLIGYLANGGYAADTMVQGVPTGNNLSFLSGADGTATVSLVEVDPASGTVVQELSSFSVPFTAGVQLYVTDVSGLSGTVTSGNTIGVMLSMESASRVDNEIRWGRTGGGPGLEQWFTITEVPLGAASPPANNPPVANANGPYSGTVDNAVSFTSNGSSDPDGDPVTYLWDFGDGNTSTQADPTHTYTAADTYTVTLTVTDSHGAERQDTTTAEITSGGGGGNQPPVADAGPDKAAQVREDIVFDASASYDPDGSIVSYGWDFGDGKTGTGAVITHKFTKDGTYTVTLTVTDDQGATGTDTAVVTVSK